MDRGRPFSIALRRGRAVVSCFAAGVDEGGGEVP